MGLKQTIKSLDAFPRAEEHLLQKTQTGALGNMGWHVYFFVFLLLRCVFGQFMLLITGMGGNSKCILSPGKKS